MRVVLNPFFQAWLICLVFLLLGCGETNVEKGEKSLELGDYPLAMGFFQQALQKDPANYRARLGMGKALIQKSSREGVNQEIWSDIVLQFEACYTLKPNKTSQNLLLQAYLNHAENLLEKSDTLATKKTLFKSLELEANSPEPYNLMGMVLAKEGKFDSSLTILHHSLRIDSVFTSSLYNLGMIHYIMEQNDSARKYLHQYMRLSPEDKDVGSLLAELKDREGES